MTNTDDFRQRLIVRQNALSHATAIVVQELNKELDKEDADVIKTRVFAYAQDFEAWIYRGEDNKETAVARQNRVSSLRRV